MSINNITKTINNVLNNKKQFEQYHKKIAIFYKNTKDDFNTNINSFNCHLIIFKYNSVYKHFKLLILTEKYLNRLKKIKEELELILNDLIFLDILKQDFKKDNNFYENSKINIYKNLDDCLIKIDQFVEKNRYIKNYINRNLFRKE